MGCYKSLLCSTYGWRAPNAVKPINCRYFTTDVLCRLKGLKFPIPVLPYFWSALFSALVCGSGRSQAELSGQLLLEPAKARVMFGGTAVMLRVATGTVDLAQFDLL